MRIDAFDVGDGACWLLRAGNDAVLFDCGSSWPAVGERVLPRAIRESGAWRVRRAIVSHPNLDHFNALPDLAERLGLRDVLVNERMASRLARPEATTPGRANQPPGRNARGPGGGAIDLLGEALVRRGITARALAAGDVFAVGPARARVLSPPRGESFRAVNDSSLVIAIDTPTAAGPKRVLLCGDAQDEAIAELIVREPGLNADVMEAPHHGSAREASIEWVARVAPSVVVQSTGPSRAADERWAAVRERRRWLSTAEAGAVRVDFRDDGSILARGRSSPESSPRRLWHRVSSAGWTAAGLALMLAAALTARRRPIAS